MKVLICASEAVPFAKTGGLADVAGALPKALAQLGHDVRLALPYYGQVEAAGIKATRVGPVRAPLGEATVAGEIFTSDAIPGVTTYLVANAKYYNRKGLYGQPDDADRFTFFCRALLEHLATSDWQPEVIHTNDWQTALIPVYLKSLYRKQFGDVRSVYTIHNLAYQGVFEPEAVRRAGLGGDYFTIDTLEFYGNCSFMKGGIVFADAVSTVSPTYSQEIQTPEFGEKLEGVLAQRKRDLCGILNGIDYDLWNPATDGLIAKSYEAKSLADKAANKRALQEQLALPAVEAPVFGLISRLAAQKGFDLLAEALPYLLEMQAQVVVLGVGDVIYHDLLTKLSRQHANQLSVNLAFDEKLAHRIYAGSDMFLMPSRYEPCGLGQLISMRYGTVPVVRATGGLADTVTNYDPARGEGAGFSFTEYSPVALLGAMARALLVYKDPKAWAALQRAVMAQDFSWNASAAQYADLYARVRRKSRKAPAAG
jgi:starch synthase